MASPRQSRQPSPERIQFGIDEVEVEPGDHIGGFYRGAVARDSVLLPYLRAGMHAGDKCVCLVDALEPEHVRARVAVGTPAGATAEQLDVRVAADTYLEDGRFSRQHMLGYLEETMTAALADKRYPLVRAAGEMSWVLREPPGADEFFDYERSVNAFAPKHRQVLLCLYDLEQFSVEMMINAIRTHPKVLFGGLLAENPWYEPDAA